MSPANSRGQPDPQLASARQSATRAALRGRGHVKAVQVAAEFGVTHETIRKDLMLLESHRLLRRVHGGAMPVESLSFEPSINERTTMAAEKKRIATAAAELPPPSGAVLFDSGTTTAALAANLPRESSLARGPDPLWLRRLRSIRGRCANCGTCGPISRSSVPTRSR